MPELLLGISYTRYIAKLHWPDDRPRCSKPCKPKAYRTLYTYHRGLMCFLSFKKFHNFVFTSDYKIGFNAPGSWVSDLSTEKVGDSEAIAVYCKNFGRYYCFTMDEVNGLEANIRRLHFVLEMLLPRKMRRDAKIEALKPYEIDESQYNKALEEAE